jgi:hypothetical protein
LLLSQFFFPSLRFFAGNMICVLLLVLGWGLGLSNVLTDVNHSEQGFFWQSATF